MREEILRTAMLLVSHSTMGMAKVEAGKQQWGYEAIIGAVIVGSISEGLLGLFAKYRRSIISPIISACVVIAIIMNLIIPKDSDD